MPSDVVFTSRPARGSTSPMASHATGCTSGAELIGQRLRAIEGAVGQMHALDAALDQSEHHRARRAAGAEHQRIFGAVPSGRAGVEIVDEPLDVGVGRAQFAVLVPQRIGRADGAGARVRLRQRQRALLVRQGDVGADEAAKRKPEDEILELVGRDRFDDVAALDAEGAQPVMMDQRRARMRRRPSDQACGGEFCCRLSSSIPAAAPEAGVAAAQIGQAGGAVNA